MESDNTPEAKWFNPICPEAIEPEVTDSDARCGEPIDPADKLPEFTALLPIIPDTTDPDDNPANNTPDAIWADPIDPEAIDPDTTAASPIVPDTIEPEPIASVPPLATRPDDKWNQPIWPEAILPDTTAESAI